MPGYISILLACLLGLTLAQQTSFEPKTGQRSLWIPFKTVSGTPAASIASNVRTILLPPTQRKCFDADRDKNTAGTVYVLSCPTSEPQCAISPNLTLTEGISTAEYATTNSAGYFSPSSLFQSAAIHLAVLTLFSRIQSGIPRVLDGESNVGSLL